MAVIAYLKSYSTLFVGRYDDYAMQVSTGRYKRVGRPLTQADLYDHLIGRRTYGTYVLDAAGTCRFAVIDADTESGDLLARLWVIQDELASQGIVSYLERSRRGGHLWIFFTRPVPSSQVRAWLSPYCPTDFELYPKQDEGKRYGSLIRLPLGVHRKSGQRYPFVERTPNGVQVLTMTDEDRLKWFASIQRVDVPQQVRAPLVPSVSLPLARSAPVNRFLGARSPIRQWNEEQDPFEVIGRYVDLKGGGVGKCPFGAHHHGGVDTEPSFKVYSPNEPGGYCWYCYTWHKGGSVFDFLRYYYDLDAATLWTRIQEKSVV